VRIAGLLARLVELILPAGNHFVFFERRIIAFQARLVIILANFYNLLVKTCPNAAERQKSHVNEMHAYIQLAKFTPNLKTN